MVLTSFTQYSTIPMFHCSRVSVEDPESPKSIKTPEEGKLLRSHRRGGNSLFQFQQSPVIHPLKEGKKVAPEESLFFEGKTAIEVDEEGLPLLGDQDVPFMSQIQVDHSLPMNLSEHIF